MALGATLYNFDVDLADADRQVYESMSIRAAKHPSESEEYLVARVLAYLLEYAEGIEFSRGVSDPDEPAVFVRDLTGVMTLWVDIGTPDPARLHRASKASPRVAVYCHKDPGQWLKQVSGATIHRADALELYAFDRTLIADLAARLDRRMAFSLSVSEQELFVSLDDATLQGRVSRLV